MHYLCFKDFANWTHRTLKRKHWIDNARLISGCGVIKNSSIEYWGTRIEWIMKISREKNILYRRTPTHYCQPSQCFVQFDNVTGSASLCWFWPYSLTQLTCFWKLLVCLCLMCFIANTEVRRMKNTAWKSAMVLPWSTEHVLSKLCFIIVQLLRNLLLHQPGLSHHLAAQREILSDRKVGRLNPKFARPQRKMTKTQSQSQR